MRKTPFVVAATSGIIICLVVMAIPESLIVAWRTGRSLSDSQAGWAYGLLVLAATGQVFYSGYVTFGPSQAGKLRGTDPLDSIARSLSRNAAIATMLTFVYGLAALRITGERGGFWLFPLLAVAQGAWLYRDVRELVERVGQKTEIEPAGEEGWSEPADFTPAIARGVSRDAG